MKLSKISIKKIITNPNQPRKTFDLEKIEELKRSIEHNGLIQPIVVRKLVSSKYYEIIAGERRFRACNMLGMKKIDAIEIEADNLKSYEIAVLENVQRENLNPIEEAESYKSLIDIYNYSQEDIAFKIGKTRSSISNKLRILKLPPVVKEYVRKGEISYGHSRTLLALNDISKIESLAKIVIKNGISVRELEKLVKLENEKIIDTIDKERIDKAETSETNKNDENSSTSINNQKIYLEDKLRDYFGTKIEIKDKKIEIEFYDYDDLERILSLLNIEFS